MNIILLSGGSGKRLWPLSNDIRSKQFIKLFKTEDGSYDSMLQRVYRQIVSVEENSNITIATSKTQVSAIKNQLGDKVSISIEPDRRDTFPAIALACAYLHDNIGIGLDEVVTICPVDFFVDDTYYELVGKMQSYVEDNNSNLTLIGIEPTYPSDKYGYIIPKSTDTVSSVREFKEKPNVEVAGEYIKQGALWNAGVFSFKLSYLMEKAHELIEFSDYNDLYGKFSEVNKISFDYAVVEKEEDIQVVRYKGDWKDIGTWNTLTEVISEDTIGNVILDENCKNVKIINELDVPLICMSCKDLVVAASADGILVADKESSGDIKSYVEQLGDTVRFAEKSWGTYTVLDLKDNAMTLKLRVNKGSCFTNDSNSNRDKLLSIVSGNGRLLNEGIQRNISAGDAVKFTSGSEHTLFADTDMEIIEVQIETSN